ncbi:MAG: L,D-transpeptidase [Synechococcus sp. Tobar2m-G35]|nr:L,D-transpeptidase [Synechococcus sp. Tobar2m-G35]
MVRSLPLPLPLSLLLLSLAPLFVPAPLRAGPLDDPDHPLRPLPLRPTELPVAVLQRPERQLVLHRSRRQLLLLEAGQLLGRWPVAVGMPGWETPAGQFRVLDKVIDPSWAHPETGAVTASGSDANPLGSRWIGFARDCTPKKAHDGERMLDIRGCTVAGFHGTPHRWTVGHAVSHGCVRLFDEDVRDVFDRVTVGTTVTVLP